MTLSIHGPMPHANGQIEVTTVAANRARLAFNPSGNDDVTRIKTLVAAIYTELDRIRSNKIYETNYNTEIVDIVEREFEFAAANIQAGAMFAVSMATAQTPKD